MSHFSKFTPPGPGLYEDFEKNPENGANIQMNFAANTPERTL
jgi:hypothetical protein